MSNSSSRRNPKINGSRTVKMVVVERFTTAGLHCLNSRTTGVIRSARGSSAFDEEARHKMSGIAASCVFLIRQTAYRNILKFEQFISLLSIRRADVDTFQWTSSATTLL